jgi:hypothetical protein
MKDISHFEEIQEYVDQLTKLLKEQLKVFFYKNKKPRKHYSDVVSVALITTMLDFIDEAWSNKKDREDVVEKIIHTLRLSSITKEELK